jgi:hypothetical protein
MFDLSRTKAYGLGASTVECPRLLPVTTIDEKPNDAVC